MNAPQLSQQALLVFLSHTASAATATKLRLQELAICHNVATKNMSQAWCNVLWLAKKYVKYAHNSLWSANTPGYSKNIDHFVLAVDACEEALKWAISTATCQNGLEANYRLHLMHVYAKLGMFYVNRSLADLRGSTEEVELWNVALSATRCLLEIPRLQVASPPAIAASFSKLKLPRVSASYGDALDTSAWKVRYTRLAWVCDVIARLLRASPGNASARAQPYRNKESAAHVAVELCGEFEMLCRFEARCPPVYLGVLAVTQAQILSSIDEACTHCDAGTEATTARQALGSLKENSLIARNLLDALSHLSVRLLQCESKAGSGRMRNEQAEGTAVALRLAREAFDRADAELGVSPLVLEPQRWHSGECGRLQQLINAAAAHLVQVEQGQSKAHLTQVEQGRSEDHCRIAYYQQQAQRVDRSISPAHALLADCWLAAALQLASGPECSADAQAGSNKDTVERRRPRAVMYAQLAAGLLAEAAGHYEHAQALARAGDDLAAEAWRKVAELLVDISQMRVSAVERRAPSAVVHQVLIGSTSGAAQTIQRLEALARLTERRLQGSHEQQAKVTLTIRLRSAEITLLDAIAPANTSLQPVLREMTALVDRVAEDLSQTVQHLAEGAEAAASPMFRLAELILEHAARAVTVSTTKDPMLLHPMVEKALRSIPGLLSTLCKQCRSAAPACAINDSFDRTAQECRALSAHYNSQYAVSGTLFLRMHIQDRMATQGSYDSSYRKVTPEIREALMTLWQHVLATLQRAADGVLSAEAPPADCPAVHQPVLVRIAEAFRPFEGLPSAGISDEAREWCRHAFEQCWNAAVMLIHSAEHKAITNTATSKVRQELTRCVKEAVCSADYYLRAVKASINTQASQDSDCAALWARAALCYERRDIDESKHRSDKDILLEEWAVGSQVGGWYANAAQACEAGETAAMEAWKAAADDAMATLCFTRNTQTWQSRLQLLDEQNRFCRAEYRAKAAEALVAGDTALHVYWLAVVEAQSGVIAAAAACQSQSDSAILQEATEKVDALLQNKPPVQRKRERAERV